MQINGAALNENDEAAIDQALMEQAKRGNVPAAKLALSRVKKKATERRSRAAQLAEEAEWKGEEKHDETEQPRPRGVAPRGTGSNR